MSIFSIPMKAMQLFFKIATTRLFLVFVLIAIVMFIANPTSFAWVLSPAVYITMIATIAYLLFSGKIGIAK